MKRKKFIISSSITLIAAGLSPSFLLGQNEAKKLPVENTLIKEFVIAGHNNLEKVKDMLNDNPNLIFCRYDWGGGDFEEAIEGAGHVGDKDIANYLISQGARVNLFALTMLGKTRIVKSALEEYPSLISAKGPHGFTLLHHAKIGGEESAELFEYLLSKGLNETKVDIHG
jgi:ankyrin repeat protein